MTSEVKERIAQIQRGEVPEGYHKTKLGIIPQEWNITKITEVLEKQNNPVEVEADAMYKQIGIRSHGKGVFYKEEISGEALGNKSIFWITPDCFVVNIVFAWEQAVAKTTQAEAGMVASHRFPMYAPKNQQVNVDYLLYFFMTKRGKALLENASPGGAGRNKTLGQKEFGKSMLFLPPLEEQQKIAVILATQDRLIKLKERIIFEKQTLEKQLMRELFTGKKRLLKFDKPVELCRLGDVCTVIMGQSPNSNNYNDNAEGLPLIQGNADLNLQERRIEPRSFTKQITKTCDANDIVMSVRAPVGTVALANEVACIGRGVCAIKSHIQNQYIYYYLRYFEDKWFKVVQGSTFDSVNGDEIKKVSVYFPESEEQNAIADILFAMEREIQLLQKELIEEKQKKKALMQLLLTGVVRVTP